MLELLESNLLEEGCRNLLVLTSGALPVLEDLLRERWPRSAEVLSGARTASVRGCSWCDGSEFAESSQFPLQRGQKEDDSAGLV